VLAALGGKPVSVRPPGACRFIDITDHCVVVNGADILSLSVRYHKVTR
jgi:hypothetical protein